MGILGFEVGWGGGLAIGILCTWAAAAYCYWFVRKLQQGAPRVLACIPVFTLYACLPLIFSRETHLVWLSTYFCIITWVGSFKVLLLCWGTGPGYDPWVCSSYPRFAIVMSFPAHIRREGRVIKFVPESTSWIDQIAESETWSMLLLRAALKIIALAVVLLILLPMRGALSKTAIHLLYTIQLYLFVTIVLEILGAIANVGFDVTVEPHFDNPFAAVSLEEFWARRWNLLVSNTLRETVYNPVMSLLRAPRTPKSPTQLDPLSTAGLGPSHEASIAGKFPQRTLKQRSSRLAQEPFQTFEKSTAPRCDTQKFVAVFATFLVSGLAHELAVYYITLGVTWEMTSFFVIQGVAVGIEAAWRTYLPYTRPPKLGARILTLGFIFATANRLFWPPLSRGGVDLQIIAEMQSLVKVF